MKISLSKTSYFFLVLSYYFLLPLYSPYRAFNLFISLILSFFVLKRLSYFFTYREERNERYFLSRVFSFISNELSAGQSLQSAFKKLLPYFQKIYASSKKISLFLNQLSKLFSSALPLEQVMLAMTEKNLLIEEHANFFNLIAEQLKEKNPLLHFFKQTHSLFQKRIALEDNIAQNQSKQQSEAFILLCLPYLIAFVLQKSFPHYLSPAFEDFFSQSLLILAFIVNQLALILSTYFFIPQQKRKSNSQEKKGFIENFTQNLFHTCLNSTDKKQDFLNYFTFLPLYLWEKDAPFAEAYEKKISLLDTQSKNYLSEKLFNLSFETACISFFVLLFALLTKSFFFLLFIPAYIFLKAKIYLNYKQEYLNRLDKEFALYFHFVFLLLHSAYSPRLALEKALHVLPSNSILHIEFQKVIDSTNRLEDFNQNFLLFTSLLPPSPIQASLNLLQQYLEHGHPDTLQLLELQLKDLWKQSHYAHKKEAEQRQLYLFLPMILSLISIFMYFLAPALSNFRVLS